MMFIAEQIIGKAGLHDAKDLVSPMRKLLATIYKVLVLADSVIIREIMQARDKVVHLLLILCLCTNVV